MISKLPFVVLVCLSFCGVMATSAASFPAAESVTAGNESPLISLLRERIGSDALAAAGANVPGAMAETDSNVTFVGSYPMQYCARLALSGSYVYLSDGVNGLFVLDVTEPESPILCGSLDTDGGAYGLAVSGSHVYLADDLNGLVIIDVSDPASPRQVGYFATTGATFDVAVQDGLAFLVNFEVGLIILDVSDPTTPIQVASTPTSYYPNCVAVQGNVVCVGVGILGAGALDAFDISDPTAPRQIGHWIVYEGGYGVAMAGRYAYVADGQSGLSIVDILDPAWPLPIGNIRTSNWAESVAVDGGFAYVADFDGGLHILDVTDPRAPFKAGSYDTPSMAEDVAICGDLVYVADYKSLQILRHDLPSGTLAVTLAPHDPPVIIPAEGGEFRFDAAVENATVSTLMADLGLQAVLPDGSLFNVLYKSNLTFPAESTVARSGLSQWVPGTAPAGVYTYRLSIRPTGGEVLDSSEFTFEKLGPAAASPVATDWLLKGWDDDAAGTMVPPAVLVLDDAVPNPFNPTTAISFELPWTGTVDLRIYDLRGRCVRTVLDGRTLEAGRHTEVWNGDDDAGRPAAGGVYIYRLQSGGITVARRMTLVK